ncbi:hypothetical protein V6N11_063581 [Hibiscus sabdariffa]|uniref:Reverse transcriptase n=2 Tax=Hibiscus sabdariffa TaxID=183260 RepID=A0ABR2CYW1_9ROSI
MGGVPFEPSQAKWFFDFLNKSCMIELPIQGGTFTWSNQRSDDDVIVEKLDRILSSLEWSEMFPRALGALDVAMASDHAPILLLLQGMPKRCKKDFKFESKWLIEDECFQEVEKGWAPIPQVNSSRNFGRKLKKTISKLIKWSRDKFGKRRRSVEEITKKIKLLQENPLNLRTTNEVKELKVELNKKWESEERHWHQRARVDWLKYGDKNTKFFHATTLQNRRANTICKMKDEHGNWMENDEDIAKHFQEHFQKIFSKDDSIHLEGLIGITPNIISPAMNSMLSRDIFEEEIREAVFSMAPLKAPGPDDFSGTFYQSFWNTI